MAEYIDREALLKKAYTSSDWDSGGVHSRVVDVRDIAEAEAADVAPVVRCKDCIFYHKAHVLCPDGTEKDASEFPPEAFNTFDKVYVTVNYGINVGAKCEVEKNCGYLEDKSVFRCPNDYCSRGKKREERKENVGNC